MRRSLFTLAVMAYSLAPSPMHLAAQSDDSTRAAVSPRVAGFTRAFQRAVRSYDVDGWSALVAEDVVMMTDGRLVEGRQEFHALWSRAFKGATGPNPLEIRVLEVVDRDDVVMVRATYGPEGADPAGHYVWLLGEGRDGTLELRWWIYDRA